MVARKPYQNDPSRMTGAAFWEDVEKQKTCTHDGVDPHRDSACPHCNLIFWNTLATMSNALKQQYAPDFADYFFKESKRG